MDILNQINKSFQSCPMCLSKDLKIQLVNSKKVEVLCSCGECNALYRFTEEDNQLYCSLTEEGSNPRKLYGIELNEDLPVEVWNQLIGPVSYCRDCGTQMFSQNISIRTGGATGPVMLIAGSWLQFFEDKLPVELHYCPKCRHIEFYAPEKEMEPTHDEKK